MRRWGLITTVGILACAASIVAWRVAVFTASIATELDRASALTNIAPRPQSTIVFDRHGKPAFSFFVEQRISVPLDRVSPHMIHAILAVEDRRFFQHFGIDPVRVAGAAWRNLRAGRIVEGGSTITQQLARAAQLSPVRTYERKIREVLVAARLEERYSKRRILEEYLNTVYFGEGYYGVEAASRGYFGKSAADLTPRRRGAARRAGAFAVGRCAVRLARTRDQAPQPRAGADAESGPHRRRGFPGGGGDRCSGCVARERGLGHERRQRRQRALFPGGSAAPAVPDVRRRSRPPRRPPRVFDL